MTRTVRCPHSRELAALVPDGARSVPVAVEACTGRTVPGRVTPDGKVYVDNGDFPGVHYPNAPVDLAYVWAVTPTPA